jgi:hypothetical protein
MLESFPTSQRTAAGQPFWSGTKRCPAALTFSVTNPAHLSFVVAAANLRAAAYGLRGRTDAEFHVEALEALAAEQQQQQQEQEEEEELQPQDERQNPQVGSGSSGGGGGGESSSADAEAAKILAAETECSSILAALPPRESLAGRVVTFHRVILQSKHG